MKKPITTTDKLCALIRKRHKLGLKKYKVTVDRTDLTAEQWLQHSIEERIDDLQYMMRANVEIAKLRKEIELLTKGMTKKHEVKRYRESERRSRKHPKPTPLGMRKCGVQGQQTKRTAHKRRV